MSSSFDKLHPPLQPSGGELQSGDTAPLVICYNRGLTRFIWSHRPLSIAARTTGSQSSSVCRRGSLCMCMGMCVGWKSSREGGLLSLNFPPWLEWMSGHSVAQLNLSISPFLWVHSVKATHTYSSRPDIIPGLMLLYMQRMRTQAISL